MGISRLYTGDDGQSHIEELDLAACPDLTSPHVAKTIVFRSTAAGHFSDWHVGPRRQYVITLSGRGEIEVAAGKKIAMGPGQINLIEDTTGKGHTTRVVGTEDRVTIAIPLADQSVSRASH